MPQSPELIEAPGSPEIESLHIHPKAIPWETGDVKGQCTKPSSPPFRGVLKAPGTRRGTPCRHRPSQREGSAARDFDFGSAKRDSGWYRRNPDPPPRGPADPRMQSPPENTVAEAVETRLAALQAEAEATEEATALATLHWAMGRLHQQSGEEAAAAKAFLTAFNADPSFRPPLMALVRLFEGRPASKNLRRLYDAEIQSATTDTEAASALVDQAALSEKDGDPSEALSHLVAAVERSPDHHGAALMLERLARSRGDAEALLLSLRRLAETATDPVWKTLRHLDLADALEADGQLEAASDAIAVARDAGVMQGRVLEAWERFARRTNQDAQRIAAHAAQGEHLLAQGDAPTDGSGAFSLRQQSPDQPEDLAAAHFFWAGHLSLHQEDAPAALDHFRRALGLRPDDALLRHSVREAAARSGDPEALGELLDGSERPEDASWLLLLSWMQQEADATDDALSSLERAQALHPGSALVGLFLDDALRKAHRSDALIERFEERAKDESLAQELRRDNAWRAAELCAPTDFSRARPLFRLAAELGESRGPLRHFYEAALKAGDAEAIAEARGALLATGDLDDEGAALRWEALPTEEPSPEALENLHQSLGDPFAYWAPDEARLIGAQHAPALLEAAHLARVQSADDDLAAAHLCAAARAAYKAGHGERAQGHLRSALERRPGHRYAVALLEEMLRKAGDAEGVVQLLKEAAEAQAGPRAALRRLLLAGAAAENSGEWQVAADTYEEAADLAPDDPSPVHALAKLARRRGDDALLLRAEEALSERERAQGAPALATLELGEHYARLGRWELAEDPLRGSLETPSASLESAIATLALPGDVVDPALHLDAWQTLLRHADLEDESTLRQALGLAAETGDLDVGLADAQRDALAPAEESEETGTRGSIWAGLTRLQNAGDLELRAEALLGLAQDTSDAPASRALLLHGLRTKLLGEGTDAADDAFLLAQELVAEAEHSAVTSVALDETLEGGDDADVRADALLARLRHGSDATRRTVAAAAGRALAAASRPEGLALLQQLVESDPEDLASWDALRISARSQKAWEEVVRACDVLAKECIDDDRAEFLEEAAAVLMDHLQDDAGAEERLRAVDDPRRTNTFHRLHDLVAERGDSEALLALVDARINAIDDEHELARLFYEQARLLRAQGNLELALQAIENLQMLDESHVGAIALAVEIHVAEQRWEDAIGALKALANADVPDAQKRISLLGAADFLEKKLGRPEAAVAELAKIEALGLADRNLYERMAALAERASMPSVAGRALLRAAEKAAGNERIDLACQAGAHLEKAEANDSAIDAYRLALGEAPASLLVAAALAPLLDANARREFGIEFEQEVRRSLERRALDADGLEALHAAAEWQEAEPLLRASAAARHCFGDHVSPPSPEPAPLGRLNAAAFGDTVLAAGDAPPAADFAKLVGPSLAVALRHDASHFGVGRGELQRRSSPAKDAAEAICRCFGLDLGEVYEGGSHRRIIAFLNKKGRTCWIFPANTDPQAPAALYELGRQGFAARAGTLPWLQLSDAEGATLLFAAAAAGEAMLDAGTGRAGLVEWTRATMKAMPRKVRKAIPGLTQNFRDRGEGLEAYVAAAKLSARRAGLLLSDDLPDVLLAAESGDLDSPPNQALLRFWLSPEAFRLRRELRQAL